MNFTKATEVLNILGARIEDRPQVWAIWFHYKGHHFIVQQTKKGSFTFTLLPPNDLNHVNTYKADEARKELNTEINIGEGKTASTIAADFERRFDWDAIQCVSDMYNQAMSDHRSKGDAHSVAVDEVAEVTGLTPWRQEPNSFKTEFNLNQLPGLATYDALGEIEVSHTDISISLRGIKDTDKAVKLIETITELFGDDHV